MTGRYREDEPDLEEVFIVVPTSVTLSDVADVLRRSWRLDDQLTIPYAELESGAKAYVQEQDADDEFMEELSLEDPGLLDVLKQRFGDYRILALRYRGPALAREWARAIASSELAEQPMLLDADGTFLAPDEFLRKLDQEPPWDWFPRSAAGA